MKKNIILYLSAFLIGFIPNFVTFNNTIFGIELAILLIFIIRVYGYQAVSGEFMKDNSFMPKMMVCFLLIIAGIILGSYIGRPKMEYLPATMLVLTVLGTFIGACIGFLSVLITYIYFKIYTYIKER